MLHYDVSDGERKALEGLLLEQPRMEAEHYHI